MQRFMAIGEAEHHIGRGVVRFDGDTEHVAHGSCTRLDGPAHDTWDGKTCNGFSAEEITSIGGIKKLSIHHAGQGIVTRGVLLDIAGLHGVPWLEPGYAIMPEELVAAKGRQGVTARTGDALIRLFRIESVVGV